MKKYTLYYLLISFLALSCTKPENSISQEKLEAISGTKTNGLSATLVKDDGFIDVDLKQLDQEIANKLKNKYQKPELAKAKAAVYRYYKTVRVENGRYVSDLKSADQIKISSQLFTLLSNNLEEMNASIAKLKAKGEKVDITEITPEYLESLLQ
jgi:hypothetical protein